MSEQPTQSQTERRGTIPRTRGRRYLVTRHPGALEWTRRCGFDYDEHLVHVKIDSLKPGDQVFGTLPVHLAAQLCAKGIEYWHLALDLEATDRGKEHTAEQLRAMGARFERYSLERLTTQEEEP